MPADSGAEDLAPSTSISTEAASVFEFLACLPAAPDTSLDYHGPRGDPATWVAGAIGDEVLSMHPRKLSQRRLGGAELRQALAQRVEHRYEELWTRR